jgi:hypothetical protein
MRPSRRAEALVLDTESRKKEEPPLLYDLTSLQRAASAQFGYTLDRTLSLVQTLYEQKKAVTYPRTSSRFLPTELQARDHAAPPRPASRPPRPRGRPSASGRTPRNLAPRLQRREGLGPLRAHPDG